MYFCCLRGASAHKRVGISLSSRVKRKGLMVLGTSEKSSGCSFYHDLELYFHLQRTLMSLGHSMMAARRFDHGLSYPVLAY